MSAVPKEITSLDWRGLSCPEPILKTARAVRALKGREGRFKILADDEAFPMDLESWSRSAKVEVLSLNHMDGAFEATILVNQHAQNDSSPPPSSSRLARPRVVPTPTPQPAPSSGPIEKLLDMRGKSCPEPVLAGARAVRSFKGRAFRLEIMADDPAFPLDVESWTRSAGLNLVSMEQEGSWWQAVVEGQGNTSNLPALNAKPGSVPVAAPKAPAAPAVSPNVALHMDLSEVSPEARQQRLRGLNQMGLEGQEVMLVCSDGSFGNSLLSWCSQHKHELLHWEVAPQLRAHLRMGSAQGQVEETALVSTIGTDLEARANRCTLLVLHNDFEALMAALMTATASAAAGMEVEIFFSFWGVNLLRGDKPQNIEPSGKSTFLQKVFAWMMPRGPGRQQLGQLNFGGMGTGIMRGIMRKNKVMDLDQLMASAVEQEVRFMVCTTSMSIMGLDKRDIAPLPNVQYGGVASFVDAARGAGLSLVF